MADVAEIKNTLVQFHGTDGYHRILGAVLTDGTKYLAEAANCFWLFQDTAIYMKGYENEDGFAVIELRVDGESGFKVMLGDGNGKWKMLFESGYTSFPRELMPFQFYACWSEIGWVHMLKSEY